jgi:hypothetical protein
MNEFLGLPACLPACLPVPSMLIPCCGANVQAVAQLLPRFVRHVPEAVRASILPGVHSGTSESEHFVAHLLLANLIATCDGCGTGALLIDVVPLPRCSLMTPVLAVLPCRSAARPNR